MKSSELLRAQLKNLPNASVLAKLADVIDTEDSLLVDANNGLQRIDSNDIYIGEEKMKINETDISFEYVTVKEVRKGAGPAGCDLTRYLGVSDKCLVNHGAIIFQHGRDPKMASIIRSGKEGLADIMLAGIITRTIYEMTETSEAMMMSINMLPPFKINPHEIDLNGEGIKFESMDRLGWGHISGVDTSDGCSIMVNRHSLISLSA